MLRNLDSKNFFRFKMAKSLTLNRYEARVAIFIFNVPARTMKRERFALAGVLVLTRTVELVAKQLANDFVILLQMVE